mmetsp:Transcript_9422/g.15876  ORF Transcript_9422/g.15876 Transcript_9422/m.15876 type:complete len:88 (-) Transcript_9422:69-332(-)
MIYSATYGLAGPSSAMVQVQGLFHTLLSAIFLKIIPNQLQTAGLMCAITGAIVMSVDIVGIVNSFFRKEDEEFYEIQEEQVESDENS